MQRRLHMKLLLSSFVYVAMILSSSAASAETGIEGVMSISPVNGGPIRIGAPESKPLPSTEFVVMKGEEQVALFQTDEEGRFKVSLPPGHYQISKAGPRTRVGHWGPFDVDVVQGQTAKVQWKCDSGMN